MSNSSHSFIHNIAIVLQLARRDMRELRSNIVTLLIDNICMLAVIIFTFNYLMPYMGMETWLIGPMLIGQVLILFTNLGFALSTKLVQDVKFNRFIEYQLGLPISTNWLITAYIVSFVIRASVIILPVLTLGILFLGKNFIVYKTSWFAFFCIYLLVAIFFGTLFIFFSFAYDYNWFWQSIWGRRIDPLYLLGSMFFVWKKLHTHAPILGKSLLLNPMTYVSEGVRATLIGDDQFIPASFCSLGLIIAISITVYLLKTHMKKALDHV